MDGEAAIVPSAGGCAHVSRSLERIQPAPLLSAASARPPEAAFYGTLRPAALRSLPFRYHVQVMPAPCWHGSFAAFGRGSVPRARRFRRT